MKCRITYILLIFVLYSTIYTTKSAANNIEINFRTICDVIEIGDEDFFQEINDKCDAKSLDRAQVYNILRRSIIESKYHISYYVFRSINIDLEEEKNIINLIIDRSSILIDNFELQDNQSIKNSVSELHNYINMIIDVYIHSDDIDHLIENTFGENIFNFNIISTFCDRNNVSTLNTDIFPLRIKNLFDNLDIQINSPLEDKDKYYSLANIGIIEKSCLNKYEMVFLR